MTIAESSVIDIVGVERHTNEVILTIVDHLPWDPETETEHLELLQSKLNAYLRFIESGEILDSYPEAGGRSLAIRIVGKFELSSRAEAFVGRARRAMQEAGFNTSLHFVLG